VDTRLDDGSETSGYWFVYGDDAEGGASKISWPVPLGNEYSPDAKEPVLDHCGGLCGTAAVISPVGQIDDHGKSIIYNGGKPEMGPKLKEIYDTLTGIQMGRLPAPEGWIYTI
jgi:hypothetical protein